jgi:hypothetical protein
MTIQDRAAELERMFSEFDGEQTRLTGKIEHLLSAWDDELKPITDLMQKHHIPFRNSEAAGKNYCGIVVGKTAESPHRLFVLKGGNVYTAGQTGGELNYHEAVSLAEYVRVADLATIKAGFEYVRKCQFVGSNPISGRNEEMSKFLTENST